MKISASNGIVLYVRADNLEDAIKEAEERLQNLNLTGVLLDDLYRIVARFGFLPGGVIGLTQIVTENRRIYETGEAHRAYGWSHRMGNWTPEQEAHYLDGYYGRPYTGD
jgi:hypothetical protein